MYSYDEAPKTVIAPASDLALQALKTGEYSVLVGRNNCGKSFLLRNLTQQMGPIASYLGPARYQNFNLFGNFAPNKSRKQQKHQEFMNYFRSQQNMDNSPVNLQLAIAELSDKKRDILREIIRLLLGTEINILHTVPGNSMSQQYLSAGGQNLSFTSSGFRLITTLITSLLDDSYENFLIDEPELGVSPEAQGVLADFLFDRSHRAKYFSHIKTLIFATHSTIFLDRRTLTNNYIVEKIRDEIGITQVSTQREFNGIHFALLGNRFETLYLPNFIILVEGKSDYAFIQKIIATRYPNQRFSVISANADNRMKELVKTAGSILGDIQRSPYHDRIVAVLDKIHGTGLKQELISMGVRAENVVVWSENGIEFFYPPSILDQIFGESGDLVVSGDQISRNGLSYTKAALADRVQALVTATTPMNPEFESSFLSILER